MKIKKKVQSLSFQFQTQIMWWEKLFPEHHLLYENHYLYENRGCDAVSDSEKSTFWLTFIFVHSHARTHTHTGGKRC